VTVACQTGGGAVGSSNVWDNIGADSLGGGRYVPDADVSSPVFGTFSPDIRRCTSVPPVNYPGPPADGTSPDELFARSTSGVVWHNYLQPNNAWTGWYPLGGSTGAALSSNVSVGIGSGAAPELFARGSDGTVWHDYLQPGSAWSGWGSLGGPSGVTLVSDVAVGYNGQGAEEVFARASDGSVWHDYLQPGNVWSGWGSLGGASTPLASDISVGYNSTGAEELFVRSSNGSVWHDYLQPNNVWTGWYPLGGAGLVSNVSVGYNGQGAEELFARASAGSVWHDYLQPGNVWSGWGSLGGASTPLASDISVGYNSTGAEELFVRSSNGSVWHDYLQPGNVWTGWYPLGAAPRATLVSNIGVGYNKMVLKSCSRARRTGACGTTTSSPGMCGPAGIRSERRPARPWHPTSVRGLAARGSNYAGHAQPSAPTPSANKGRAGAGHHARGDGSVRIATQD
jgi:hypothetical protein